MSSKEIVQEGEERLKDKESSSEESSDESSTNHDSNSDQSDSESSDDDSGDVNCMRLGNLLVIEGTDVVVDRNDPLILGTANYDYQLGAWELVVPQYPTEEMKRCAKKYNYVLPRSCDTNLIRELDQLEDTIECTMRNLIEAVRDMKRMIRP